MRIFRAISVIVVSSVLWGCAIRPVPDNLPGVNTVDIAKSIYCELHQALKHQVYLAFKNSDNVQAQMIAEELLVDEAQVWYPHVREGVIYLDRRYRNRILFFKNTDVGFTYRFNITLNDVIHNTAKFTLPFTTTTFTLGLDAKQDKKRANEVTFKVVGNFYNIVNDPSCVGKGKNRRNYIYPITGSIGLRESVQTLVDFERKKVKLATDASTGTYSEKLTFTTEFSGGVNPSVTLGKIAKDFRLTEASLDFDASRSDIHEVTVLYSLKDPAEQILDPLSTAPVRPNVRRVTKQLDNTETQSFQRIIIDDAEFRGLR